MPDQLRRGRSPPTSSRCSACSRRRSPKGVDLVALPEVWPLQGSATQIREAAEPIPGPRTDRLAEFAARHHVWVHGGSVLERDGDRVFNTSVLFDRDG